jgi:uncharacterized protein
VSEVPHEQDDQDLPELTNDAKNWAVMCHLAALIGLAVPPFGFFLGPLFVWLLKRNEHPYIDENGKEAFNFQVSALIYAVLLCCLIITIPLLLVLIAADVILTIVAAIKASNGEVYRYPFALRLIN